MDALPLAVIHDPPADGAWNMALDEALLESAAADGCAWLRFYQWRPAVLSLGYFQRTHERSAHASSTPCPVVRRASGGGAIVHDRELTYSLCVPRQHALAADAPRLYRLVHQALIDVLAGYGVSAQMHPGGEKRPAAREPFLCFERRAAGDLVCGEAKITGSAQRRHRGAVLQHGSILLAQSPAAPELPGILELTGRSIAPADLAAALVTQLGRTADLSPRAGNVPAEVVQRARELVTGRYGNPRWTDQR